MKYRNFKKSYITKNNSKSLKVKNYIYATNYSEHMINDIEPIINNIKKNGYITGIKNMKLYYETYIVENAKGNIVICHGIGEYTEKYNEMIYYFISSGYSVFIMEHRGNGRSGRLGGDIGQISVESFEYYIEDFKKFIDEIVIPNKQNKKLILFAHSMGGGIGTYFIEKYTEYFDGAVLSSPMHQISTGKAPSIAADILCRCLVLFGRKNEYMPGQKPYTGKRKFPSRSTSCEERYNYQYNKILSNKDFQTGGASAKWYLEATKGTRFITSKKNISKVKIPILLFQAEYDTHVTAKAQCKFAHYAHNCELVRVQEAKHETYFETDDITNSVIEKIFDFIEYIF